MTQSNQERPIFITEEIEAELRAAGYVFKPPPILCRGRLRDILAQMSDAGLAAWPGELADEERERRRKRNHEP